MKDDAYRRILQLERRVQSLSDELISVRNQRRNVPMPGSRMALLQPVSSIAGMTESSGTYSVSHGEARIYDLIVRDTTSAWEMTKVSGNSVDKTVMLGNVSTEALAADEFVFALSYNGIYLNTLGGDGGGYPLIHCVTPSEGIPARNVSDLMGSALCDVYDSNTSGALTDSSTNLTIYNPSRTAIAGSSHIAAVQNQAGIWVAIFEDCGVVE